MTTEQAGFLIVTGWLAAVFILGGKVRLGDTRGGRGWLSASAGVATAYVFVHVLPELSAAQETFTQTGNRWLALFPEYRIYTAALAGFVVFYGFENLVTWSNSRKKDEDLHDVTVYTLHIVGYAIYGGSVTYVMGQDLEKGMWFLALFAVAMGLHFLGMDHSIRREHGERYNRTGKWLLAGGVVAGWAVSQLASVPTSVATTMFGFVAGGVLINSLTSELPREKEGRFWPFVWGVAAYAVLLLVIEKMVE